MSGLYSKQPSTTNCEALARGKSVGPGLYLPSNRLTEAEYEELVEKSSDCDDSHTTILLTSRLDLCA